MRLYHTTTGERAAEILLNGFSAEYDGGHPLIAYHDADHAPWNVLCTWIPLGAEDGWPDKVLRPVHLCYWPREIVEKRPIPDRVRAILSIDFQDEFDLATYGIRIRNLYDENLASQKNFPSGEYYIPVDLLNSDIVRHIRISRAMTEADLTEELERDEIYTKRSKATDFLLTGKMRTWQLPGHIAWRLGEGCWDKGICDGCTRQRPPLSVLCEAH